jgi:hypothetical protein
MFATFHPFPAGVWIVGIVVAALLPPAVVLCLQRPSWIRGTLIVFLFLTAIGAMAVIVDLDGGWRWRQNDVYGNEEIRSLSWWYSPYWHWVTRTVGLTFAFSAVATVGLWMVIGLVRLCAHHFAGISASNTPPSTPPN